jgi:hypothetical protein
VSQVSGAEGRDTEVWAKKAEASTAEVTIDGIRKLPQKARTTRVGTNQTLIGIGSSVKRL